MKTIFATLRNEKKYLPPRWQEFLLRNLYKISLFDCKDHGDILRRIDCIYIKKNIDYCCWVKFFRTWCCMLFQASSEK